MKTFRLKVLLSLFVLGKSFLFTILGPWSYVATTSPTSLDRKARLKGS